MSSVEKMKVWLAVCALAAGMAGYYLIPSDAGLGVWGIVSLLLGLLCASGMFCFSAPGQRFLNYARDSGKEMQKVVWPSKKETWQMTGIVFVFVVIVALMMMLFDSVLKWVFYDLILGRI